ncbi:MAG TPA: carbohydrate-binding family 9-like protein [Tepidisphaeraceae bacterium]|nr:carbohydrate-binding family 9-like protein [Tepidisphaeraceae bacterium]
MRPITPRGYVCGRATTPITIDGNADEPAWAAAPWTADFVDIEDAAHAKPRFRTRAKMLWDDENLYIYAQLQEPHVWGTLTHKNDIIFQDNDFEIFIDPNGDNHNYYEYEMNALNTIWELTLPKPYRDDGQPQLGTNIPGLRSAVHVDGTLNDPHDTDRGWSVEIAIPWKGLARYADGISCPPKDGQQWRMDFSRVEWLVDIIDGKYHKIPKESRAEDNWVWSPTGIIDMHRPERWGFVQFSTAGPGAAGFHPDPTLPARDALMDVYYRQRAFKQRFGRYASSLRDLHMSGDGSAGLEPPIEMKRQGADTKDIDRAIEQGLVSPIEVKPSAAGYIATAKVKSANGATRVLHVRQDSKLWEE